MANPHKVYDPFPDDEGEKLTYKVRARRSVYVGPKRCWTEGQFVLLSEKEYQRRSHLVVREDAPDHGDLGSPMTDDELAAEIQRLQDEQKRRKDAAKAEAKKPEGGSEDLDAETRAMGKPPQAKGKAKKKGK